MEETVATTDARQTEDNRERLERWRKIHAAADTRIGDVYNNRAPWGALNAAYQDKMRAAYATVKDDGNAGAAWQRLVNHAGAFADLRALEPVVAYLGPQPGNTLLDALLLLALHHEHWRSDPETWQPRSASARQLVGGLVRHLLTRYAVPGFLDAAWFEGFAPAGAAHRKWFVEIGMGGSVRRVSGLPLRLTEKAAHHFLQAPSEFSIVGALRWGQILALGGDSFLAQAVADSRMGAILPDEPFWHSLLHFFVNNPQMNIASVGPIVDFLFAQKFGDSPPVPGPDDEPIYEDAPEPGLTMKGRTLPALLKRVEEWRDALARESKRPRTSWAASGIGGLSLQKRDLHGHELVWTVRELLDSKALQAEGREMRHCVFSYGPQCAAGSISIWSVRVRQVGELRARSILTVEVNQARRAIVQARGKANATVASARGPSRLNAAGAILRQWAREQRLSVACNV